MVDLSITTATLFDIWYFNNISLLYLSVNYSRLIPTKFQYLRNFIFIFIDLIKQQAGNKQLNIFLYFFHFYYNFIL